jgi:hypothetical protein
VSKRKLQGGSNLLSALASTIGMTVGVGLPMAMVIIWVCS